MNLLPEWRWLVRKAWSVRLMALAAVLSGVEVALPFFVDAFPRGVFAAISAIVVASAFVARIVAQPKMDRRATSPQGDRRKKTRTALDAEKADFND